MPTTATCLSGLVGLSAAGSACFPLPAEGSDYITTAAQGLFIDDVEGLPLKPASQQSPGADLYGLLNRARRQAEQVVVAALAAPLAASLGPPRFGAVGLLGGQGNGRPASGPARLDFTTAYLPGLGLELRAAMLHATGPTEEPVSLTLDGLPIGALTANAGQFAPLLSAGADAGPVLVPFDGQAHELRAVLPEGVSPLLSTLTCNCGGDPWVTALRGQLAPGFNLKAETAGLQLQARIVCLSESGPLCAALAQDAEATRFAALAVLYKSAEHLLVHFLANVGYNRYTTLEPQSMVALAKRYEAKAAEYLNWLNGPDGLKRLPNDCYACRPGPLHLKLVR